MSKYKGVVIAESLDDTKVLDRLKITSTKVEQVTESHQTPHLSKWTLHSIELDDPQVEEAAAEISRVIQPKWYAHFYDDNKFVVVFRNKVFHFQKKDAEARQRVSQYGISLGIPDYQMDLADQG